MPHAHCRADDGSLALLRGGPQQTRRRFVTAALAALALVVTLGAAPAARATGEGFDFDTGNAFLEVFLPVGQAELATSPEAPGTGDPTLLLRLTTMTDVGSFDAIAPYNPTMVGIHSHIARQPAAKQTQRNKNIALLYAVYRVVLSLQPGSTPAWRNMMSSVGLDPDANKGSPGMSVGHSR